MATCEAEPNDVLDKLIDTMNRLFCFQLLQYIVINFEIEIKLFVPNVKIYLDG